MSDLLLQARLDTRLSYRAKGLLDSVVHMHHGIVPSSRELTAYSREGRDAVRATISELVEHGYLHRHRYQTRSGQWETVTAVTPSLADFQAPVADFQASATRLVTEAGFSGSGGGFSGPLPSVSSTANELPTSELSILLSPNGDRSTSARLTARQVEETPFMGYAFLPTTSTAGDPDGIGLRTESAEQKKSRRSASTDAVTVKPRATDARHDKDPSRWTTADMAAEFGSLCAEHAEGMAGQVNYKALGSNLSRFRKQGASAQALVLGIQQFFADPSHRASVGRGIPLWKSFLVWFPTQQARLEVSSGAHDDGMDAALSEMADESATRPRRF